MTTANRKGEYESVSVFIENLIRYMLVVGLAGPDLPPVGLEPSLSSEQMLRHLGGDVSVGLAALAHAGEFLCLKRMD